MKQILLLLALILPVAGNAQDVRWYNTDSLLDVLSRKPLYRTIMAEAGDIYSAAGIDSSNISPAAFRLAYLEKRLIDRRRIHVRHRRHYRNRSILSIADYSKPGNRRRFATVDITHRRLLFDTLVSQGSGTAAARNDKYNIPVYFSNTRNSELSSLGMIVTRRARQPENPCHFCRYIAATPHLCTVILNGMEKGTNHRMKQRDIVMHTTGSAGPGDAAVRHGLFITDTGYRISSADCKCYHTYDNGTVKGIGAYASACGLAENNGYIGQSNGCLVLPEDDHIGIMNTLSNGSLIFAWSNVICNGSSYLTGSKLVRRLIRRAKR